MGTGDEVAAVRTREGRAEDPPFRHRGDRDVRRGGLTEGGLGFVATGQFREGEPAIAGGVGEDAVAEVDRGGVDLPALGCQPGQDSARGGGGLADGGDGGGGGAAAGGGPVVGDGGGVGHQHPDPVRGDAEFLGGGLGEFGAGALAHFHFAGQDGDGAVLGQVEAGGDRRVGATVAASGGRFWAAASRSGTPMRRPAPRVWKKRRRDPYESLPGGASKVNAKSKSTGAEPSSGSVGGVGGCGGKGFIGRAALCRCGYRGRGGRRGGSGDNRSSGRGGRSARRPLRRRWRAVFRGGGRRWRG